MLPQEPIGHVPVLPDAVAKLVGPQPGEIVVDATVGLAGHAKLFAEAIGPTGTLIGVDVDPANLAEAKRRLADVPCRVRLIRGNFALLPELLGSVGVEKVDVIFADLGVSSAQLDQAERGFSFQREGPLDMRMDPDLRVTAAEFVNRLKERELGELLYRNSQEPASRAIARSICEARRDARITSTKRLADVVADAVHVNPESRKSKIHPATRVFLALRMAVNDELNSLNALLESAPGLLKPGGRLGIIAFHSLEDKPVKLDFRRRKKENIYRLVTNKPVVADEEERRRNPRSRSAKLRVAIRLLAD